VYKTKGDTKCLKLMPDGTVLCSYEKSRRKQNWRALTSTFVPSVFQ